MNNKIILILILLLGLILRILDIQNNPPSLYGDELTIAYDAYSLLKTGQDQLGNPYPLTFEMGAGRPAGYVYFSFPFVALFGPSALGVRMLSILSGLGIIFLLYLLGRKFFSEQSGLVAAALTAFSPWDISLSRGGFEAHLALFLVLLATYLFLAGLKKPVFYVFSSLFFGLTIHTYPTYKLVLPLFLPFLIWFRGNSRLLWDSKIKVYLFASIIILFILVVLSLNQTLTRGSESRFSDINIFSKVELKAQIEQKINFERSFSTLPQGFVRIFHNKAVETGKVFIENYLQNFSLDFLIIHGDGHPRHNMATMGEIYLAQFVLFFVGLISFWSRYKKVLTMLLVWLFIAPIPTAIVDAPHALRSAFMLPPIIMISALGAVTLINQKSKIFLTAVGILFFIQFAFFAQKLFFLSAYEYSNFWAHPAKEASEIVKLEKDNFNYVLLSDKIDNLEFAYPLYAKVDPNIVIRQNQKKEELGGYQFKKFDNVYLGYIPDSEIENFILNLSGSVLYIGSVQKRDILLDHDIIKGKDNLPALLVIRKK